MVVNNNTVGERTTAAQVAYDAFLVDRQRRLTQTGWQMLREFFLGRSAERILLLRQLQKEKDALRRLYPEYVRQREAEEEQQKEADRRVW